MSEVHESNNDIMQFRWDALAGASSDPELQSMPLANLARAAGLKPWSGTGTDSADTVGKFVRLSYAQLSRDAGLQPRQIRMLIQILESAVELDTLCGQTLEPGHIAGQAFEQRIRIADRFGLDFNLPVQVMLLDPVSAELCRVHSVRTLIELIRVLDQPDFMRSNASAVNMLRNALAHGDPESMGRVLPCRGRRRGVFLVEAINFCFERLTDGERATLAHYLQKRAKTLHKSRANRPELPELVSQRLLPDAIACLSHFSKNDPEWIDRLTPEQSDYLDREVMFLEPRERSLWVHWLLRLAVGVYCLHCDPEVEAEVEQVRLPRETEEMEVLRRLVTASSRQAS